MIAGVLQPDFESFNVGCCEKGEDHVSCTFWVAVPMAVLSDEEMTMIVNADGMSGTHGEKVEFIVLFWFEGGFA